jgi:DNA modification methylase
VKIDHLPIGKVKVNPDNPRQIGNKEFQSLVKSLKDCPSMFEARPLLVSNRTGENIVLGGNMRLRAAQELKYKEVPVIILPGLTKRQEQEITIKDNGAWGEWDFDALANAWSDLPLKDWGVDIPADWGADQVEPADAEPQIDKAAELNKKWKVKTGDLFIIGDHRLLCGDSTKREDVERVMGGGKSQMVFTDPPYNVDYGANKKRPSWKIRSIENDKQSPEEWERFCRDIFALFKEFNEGDIYMWGASCPEGMKMRLWLTEMGCHWSATIIWKKQQLVLSPANYQRMYEPCFYGWFGKSSFQGSRTEVEVWEIDRPLDSKLHPTMKPIDLCVKGIENSSTHGAVVMDLFLGSGSTMVACQNLSRKCRGIEISPNYCAVILQRMTDAFPDIKIERVNVQ